MCCRHGEDKIDFPGSPIARQIPFPVLQARKSSQNIHYDYPTRSLWPNSTLTGFILNFMIISSCFIWKLYFSTCNYALFNSLIFDTSIQVRYLLSLRIWNIINSFVYIIFHFLSSFYTRCR